MCHIFTEPLLVVVSMIDYNCNNYELYIPLWRLVIGIILAGIYFSGTAKR